MLSVPPPVALLAICAPPPPLAAPPSAGPTVPDELGSGRTYPVYIPRRRGRRATDQLRCLRLDSLFLHFEVRGDMGDEGLIPTTKEFGTALGDIVRCTECGHMQLDRFPTEEELNAEYAKAASDDYVEEEAGQRVSAARVLERTERYAGPGKLLDLGCWVGLPDGRGARPRLGPGRASSRAPSRPTTPASGSAWRPHRRPLHGRPARGAVRRGRDGRRARAPHPRRRRARADRHPAQAGRGARAAAAGRRQPRRRRSSASAGGRSSRPTSTTSPATAPRRCSAATATSRSTWRPTPRTSPGEYYLNKGGGYLPGLSKRLIAMAAEARVRRQDVHAGLRRPDDHDRPPAPADASGGLAPCRDVDGRVPRRALASSP